MPEEAFGSGEAKVEPYETQAARGWPDWLVAVLCSIGALFVPGLLCETGLPACCTAASTTDSTAGTPLSRQERRAWADLVRRLEADRWVG